MASEQPKPFDESALLADACRKTGLTEFGAEGFRTPLRVLLASLADAPLNAVGTTVLRSSIRRSLEQRLLAQDWFARHPKIADERIAGPLVVVGMMRSGTTLIQRLLARDPRRCGHRTLLRRRRAWRANATSRSTRPHCSRTRVARRA